MRTRAGTLRSQLGFYEDYTDTLTPKLMEVSFFFFFFFLPQADRPQDFTRSVNAAFWFFFPLPSFWANRYWGHRVESQPSVFPTQIYFLFNLHQMNFNLELLADHHIIKARAVRGDSHHLL